MNVSVVNVDVSEVKFAGSRLERYARDNRGTMWSQKPRYLIRLLKSKWTMRCSDILNRAESAFSLTFQMEQLVATSRQPSQYLRSDHTKSWVGLNLKGE